MNYRRLGRAGLKLSELSFGAFITFSEQVSDEVAFDCMVAAYEAGVNYFDNAEVYGHGQAEIVMGKALKRAGWRREDLVISTKLFWGGEGPNDRGLSHKHLLEGVNASLRRLQLEYVDLLFCHRPDPATPIEETVRAIDIIIRQGKAFYWGTSEWSAVEILRADGLARQFGLTPPVMEQPQYHMFQRARVEKEYRPLYTDLGYGLTTWSPLAGGLLSGKYNQGIPAGSRANLKGNEELKNTVLTSGWMAQVAQLKPIADELGCSLAQLAIGWCLKNPNVSTVITGASRPEQVRENMRASVVAPQLAAEIMARIEAVLGNRPN